VSRGYAGKTAVVTGAGSGIGRELALNLAGRGALLALSDINAENAERTAADCRQRGAQATAWQLDVADRAAVFANAADVIARYNQVHLVINNAGVSVNGRVSELSEDDHRWIMGINYWGMVHGTQAFLPHLRASRGQLANVSSVFGLIAFPGQSAYNASKFAIRGFTEALRMELAADGVPVAVSLVHPGGIKTNITRSARIPSSQDRKEAVAAFDKVAVTTAAKAARTILRGLERDKPRILVGPDAWAIAAIPRVLGARYLGLLARLG